MKTLLTERQKMAVKDFSRYYQIHKIPPNLTEIIKDRFGIDVSSKYGPKTIKNPVMVAPGQITRTKAQVGLISEAGYGGLVLKSFVGEDRSGSCSLKSFRLKPKWIKTFYEADDLKGEYPIIHWNGGLDIRDWNLYRPFVRQVYEMGLNTGRCVVASLLCHLPQEGEEWLEAEWVYTTKELYGIGYRIFEIDFCPYLKSNNLAKEKKTVLRWYRQAPQIMKKAVGPITVFPKLLNPGWGDEFQVQMVEASVAGGADGVVIANRIYKPEYNSAHGGRELKEINLRTIKKVRKKGLKIPISATGGIYTGKDIMDYIKAGAESTQLISYIMGQVKAPFVKQGNKLEKVLFKLIFNPEDGLIAEMLKIKNSSGLSSMAALPAGI